MKNNSFLRWGLFVLIGVGLTAYSVSSTDPNQDQDEAIIWQLIAERDSLRTVIDELEDENLYLYEELETIKQDCGVK